MRWRPWCFAFERVGQSPLNARSHRVFGVVLETEALVRWRVRFEELGGRGFERLGFLVRVCVGSVVKKQESERGRWKRRCEARPGLGVSMGGTNLRPARAMAILTMEEPELATPLKEVGSSSRDPS